MGFLDKLLGGAGGSSEPRARVIHGLKSILDNEKTFDANDRAIFWQSHIAKCKDWDNRMSKILLQSPDQDTPHEALLRMSSSGHIAQAATIAALIGEIEISLAQAGEYQPDQAATSPACLRLVCFSNVISYAATSGRNISFTDMDNLYVSSLQALGLQMAISETSFKELYDQQSAQTTLSIRMDLDDLEVVRLAAADFVNVRGATPEEGWRSIPPFMTSFINNLMEHVRAAESQTISLTPLKKTYPVLLLDEQVRMIEFRSRGKWPWHNRPMVPVAPDELQMALGKARALAQRVSAVQ